MKSIKTNPNSAKGPDKGKIVNKLYCIKKIHGHRILDFFLISNPGLLFLLKVRSYVFISNFHHSPPPPPKGYKIVSLIIN
jgi:hypothetical protein